MADRKREPGELRLVKPTPDMEQTYRDLTAEWELENEVEEEGGRIIHRYWIDLSCL